MYPEIQKKISSLPPNKQLLFGISCIKRITISIDEYLISPKSITTIAYLNTLIDEVFIGCSLELFDKTNNRLRVDHSSLLDQLIPDTDEDGSHEAVLLQNAAIGVAYCLDFTKAYNHSYIYYCSMKAIETVDTIALGILNVNSSDLMLSQEVGIQNQLLDAIVNLKDDIEGIKAFKDSLLQLKMAV